MADSSTPSLAQRLKMEVDKMIEGLVSGKPNAEQLRNTIKQKLATIHCGDHPVYPVMIQEAITDLGEELGSTRDAISEFIVAKYHVVEHFHTPKLIEQLEKLVQKNELVLTPEGRYMLASKVIAPEKVKRRGRGRPPKSQKEQGRVETLRDLRVEVKKDPKIISKPKVCLHEKEAVKSESPSPCRDDVAPSYREWWLREAAKLFSFSASEGCDKTQALDISSESSDSSELEDQVNETVDQMEAELRSRGKNNCNSESQVEQNSQLVGNSECELMHKEMIKAQMETQEKSFKRSQTSKIPEDCSRVMVEAETQNSESEKTNHNSESQVEQSALLHESSELESMDKETIETQKETQVKRVEASEKQTKKDNVPMKKLQYPSSKIPICLGIPRLGNAPVEPSVRSTKKPKYARASFISSKSTPEMGSSVWKEGRSSACQESETSQTQLPVESEPSGFEEQFSRDTHDHSHIDNPNGGISTPRGGSTSRGRKLGSSQENSRGGITPRGSPKVNRGGWKQTRRPKVLG